MANAVLEYAYFKQQIHADSVDAKWGQPDYSDVIISSQHFPPGENAGPYNSYDVVPEWKIRVFFKIKSGSLEEGDIVKIIGTYRGESNSGGNVIWTEEEEEFEALYDPDADLYYADFKDQFFTTRTTVPMITENKIDPFDRHFAGIVKYADGTENEVTETLLFVPTRRWQYDYNNTVENAEINSSYLSLYYALPIFENQKIPIETYGLKESHKDCIKYGKFKANAPVSTNKTNLTDYHTPAALVKAKSVNYRNGENYLGISPKNPNNKPLFTDQEFVNTTNDSIETITINEAPNGLFEINFSNTIYNANRKVVSGEGRTYIGFTPYDEPATIKFYTGDPAHGGKIIKDFDESVIHDTRLFCRIKLGPKAIPPNLGVAGTDYAIGLVLEDPSKSPNSEAHIVYQGFFNADIAGKPGGTTFETQLEIKNSSKFGKLQTGVNIDSDIEDYVVKLFIAPRRYVYDYTFTNVEPIATVPVKIKQNATIYLVKGEGSKRPSIGGDVLFYLHKDEYYMDKELLAYEDYLLVTIDGQVFNQLTNPECFTVDYELRKWEFTPPVDLSSTNLDINSTNLYIQRDFKSGAFGGGVMIPPMVRRLGVGEEDAGGTLFSDGRQISHYYNAGGMQNKWVLRMDLTGLPKGIPWDWPEDDDDDDDEDTGDTGDTGDTSDSGNEDNSDTGDTSDSGNEDTSDSGDEDEDEAFNIEYDDGKLSPSIRAEILAITTKELKWDYSKTTSKPFAEAKQIWINGKRVYNQIGKRGEISDMILNGDFDRLEKFYHMGVKKDLGGVIMSIGAIPKKYKNNINTGYRISYYMALFP